MCWSIPALPISIMRSWSRGGAALGFIIPAMAVNYLFSRLSLKLFLIDAGYWLVIYVLMGVALSYLL